MIAPVALPVNQRYGFFVRANRIRDGRCPECETPIDGIGLTPTSAVEGWGAMINDDVR